RRNTKCQSNWSSDVCSSDVKYMILFDIVQEFRPTEPSTPTGLIPFGVMDLHGHEALRIRVGEWLHHDVIDDAENGRRSANPQSQRDDRNRRKPWRLPQVSKRIPDVLP